MTGGTVDLGAFLQIHTFALLMIFTRVGTCFMMFPGIGEASVPSRVRLMIAVSVSAAMLTTLEPFLPPEPASPPELAVYVGGEALVGAFFGVMIRCMLAALDTAGTLISIQLGIGSAAIFNPEMAVQTSLPSTILSLVGLVLIFLTNSHHAMLKGLVASYDIFKPGHVFSMLDYSQAATIALAKSFYVGVAMAAPFLVIGIAFSFSLGLIARMVPQLQVYFMAIPLQILGGFFAFAGTVSAMMMFWLSRMPEFLPGFFVTGQ